VVVNGEVVNGVVVENVVLGPSMVTTEPSIIITEPSMVITGCIQLLKTGSKKGTACNCKIFMDGMCKRHHLIHL
jgi:hypothetical protein